MLKIIFNPKYIFFLFVFCIFWNWQWKELPPWWLVSGPTAIVCLYIIGASLYYVASHKREIKREHALPYILIVVVVLYAIVSVPLTFKYQNFDYLWRNTIVYIANSMMIGCAFFMSRPDILKRICHFFFAWFIIILLFDTFYCNLSINCCSYCIFFLIFYRFIPARRRWVMWIILPIFIFLPGQRMQFLRILISVGLALTFGFIGRIPFLKRLSRFFLVAPILFLILGMSGVFNVFNFNSYLKPFQYGEEDITADTRSFIYEESSASAINGGYVIFGRSFARGYDSMFQAGRNAKTTGEMVHEDDVAYRNSEVFIPNQFTWMGIIGVVLFFCLFIYSYRLAVNKSNNKYMPIIGLIVCIQWALCWIENCNAWISIDLFFMYMQISMCLSRYWRDLSDREFESKMKEILSA